MDINEKAELAYYALVNVEAFTKFIADHKIPISVLVKLKETYPYEDVNSLSAGLSVEHNLNKSLVIQLARAFQNICKSIDDISRLKNTNIEYAICHCSLNLITSDSCANFDSKLIPVNDIQIGLNAPPHSVECSCRMSPYYSRMKSASLKAHDPIGNRDDLIVLSNNTYDNWKNELAKRYGLQTFNMQHEIAIAGIYPFDKSFISFYNTLPECKQLNFKLFTAFQLKCILENNKLSNSQKIDILKEAVKKTSYPKEKSFFLRKLGEAYEESEFLHQALIAYNEALSNNSKIGVKKNIARINRILLGQQNMC